MNLFSTLTSALSSSGITGTQATSVLSSVAGSLVGSVSSQVNQDLTQLMALLNNSTAYAAAAPAIVQKIMTINGLPSTVLPLLVELQKATDPLQVSQLVTQIETIVSAQTSIL